MAHNLLTELQIAGVWTPIPTSVLARSPVVIERGRRDEDAVVGPSKVRLQLDNRDGRYSPRNPRSDLYGLIGKNTPIRFSVPVAEPYLAMTGVSGDIVATPDHSSLDVTGDLDVAVELTAGWHGINHQTLIGKWSTADGNRSWICRLVNGLGVLAWSPTGLSAAAITASIELPQLPHRAALRFTLDVNNGSGGWTVTLYWAETLAGPWHLVGTQEGTGTTSIYSGTAPLEIAPTQIITAGNRPPWRGKLHRAEVRAGISGTVVASPDVRALTPGTTSWADSAGRTWTVAGAAAVTDREYRLHAEVSSWNPRWDASGKNVYVPAEGAGILRRLGQGAKALASPLRRRIPTVGAPKAYWPMEDGRDARQAYSPLAGVAPLTVSGLEFAADDSLGGSASLPRLTATATMLGTVPAHASTGQWMLGCVFYWPAAPASSTRLLTFNTSGTAQTIILNVDNGSVLLEGYTSTGAVLFSIPSVTIEFHASWNRLELTAETSGGTVTYRLGWIDVSGNGWGATTTVAASAGTITGIATTCGPLAADVRLGHLGVFASSSTAVYERADDGWLGENASSRLLRLSTEEGVPLTTDLAPTAMGPQRPDRLLTLLGECEAADGGVLFESRDRLGLHYRSRESFYNRPVGLVLDYNAEGHVAPPLEPTDDDQGSRNAITVSRTGGSSAPAIDETSPLSVLPPPDGIGVYEHAPTLSVATDGQLAGIASWRLHLGTWDEGRYPTVHIDLAAPAAASLIPSVLALDIGDRIQIINPPHWLPPGPIDLIVEGYTETFGRTSSWDIVLNCSPAGPWTVAVLDDPDLSRAESDGTTLDAGLDADDTVVSITTPVGPLWTTDILDTPLDVLVGGEVMTVTMINGSRQDRYQRLVTSGWGTTDSGQTWTTSGGAAADFSVQGA
ncbi:hypothetical protein [Streptomyces sp. TBY4]|uniref:hypothetical protein n=1 Tax=Streptomyces sp. TBY4 TaxID=2962030 RepID=UPI0020B7DB3F|nr:hypothetical protein [Streptomyces sp. TBY4]MCP3758220.1 hypothetical protein [Streptomyces sp. TBY4]